VPQCTETYLKNDFPTSVYFSANPFAGQRPAIHSPSRYFPSGNLGGAALSRENSQLILLMFVRATMRSQTFPTCAYQRAALTATLVQFVAEIAGGTRGMLSNVQRERVHCPQ
jgi:hypothetical protein